jgi:hypothetical protein
MLMASQVDMAKRRECGFTDETARRQNKQYLHSGQEKAETRHLNFDSARERYSRRKRGQQIDTVSKSTSVIPLEYKPIGPARFINIRLLISGPRLISRPIDTAQYRLART